MVDRARTSGTIAVGLGSTQVIGYNVSRSTLILSNAGANKITLMLQTGRPLNDDGTVNYPTAVADTGIVLQPNTPPLVLYDYTGPVTAIAAVGVTALAVAEL